MLLVARMDDVYGFVCSKQTFELEEPWQLLASVYASLAEWTSSFKILSR